MAILKANPKGGAPIKPGNYPLAWDNDGRTGYKIGYCENCGKPQILALNEFYEFIDDMTTQTAKAVSRLENLMAMPTWSFDWRRKVKTWVEKL